ncbi:MAG: GFA family protein [Alphaproteobacteria bacterium]|nr:GFA family protein [Alphaproteobacteria bacterium]
MPYDGGCACGAVRYRLEAEPFDGGYCHCTICRRSAGAPVLAFATVPLDKFVIVEGAPAKRRSSSFGERWFCSGCGTQLAMRVDHQPDTIDFSLASLDDPNVIAPAFHIFTEDRIGWFETADNCPRHASFRPHTRGL